MVQKQSLQGVSEGTFPQFSRLPPELRLLIWEATWPESRVIEIGSRSAVAHAPEPDRCQPTTAVLRTTYGVLAWLQKDFDNPNHWPTPSTEFRSNPTALQVCYESRAHASKSYKRFKHSRLDHGFYFNPQRDFLACTAASYRNNLRGYIQEAYGTCLLDSVQLLLIGSVPWGDLEIHQYHENIAGAVPNVRDVRVLMESYEHLKHPEIGSERLDERANDLRERYTGNNSMAGLTATFIDRSHNVY